MEAFEREYYEILSIGNDGKWKDIQRFYDATGHLQFVCRHMANNPGDDDVHWNIWKLTYVDGKCVREESQIGSVTRRTLLDWA